MTREYVKDRTREETLARRAANKARRRANETPEERATRLAANAKRSKAYRFEHLRD